MDKFTVTIDIMQNKLNRALFIGEKPYKEVMGTDLENEYGRILHNMGLRVLKTYKRMTKEESECRKDSQER